MRAKYDMTPLQEMFEKDIEPSAMANQLDQMLWAYIDVMLSGVTGETGSLMLASIVYDVHMLQEVISKLKPLPVSLKTEKQ